MNNDRVIAAFADGSQAKRRLLLVPGLKVSGTVGQVEISLSLDLIGHESGVARYIYYNLRAAPLHPGIAKAAIDIAHWVLAQAGADVPVRQIEYFDFAANRLYRAQARRSGTIRRLRANARIIETLWPTL